MNGLLNAKALWIENKYGWTKVELGECSNNFSNAVWSIVLNGWILKQQ